ncbi:group I intron-associated PD-(D/E)XK endonuclease [Microbacterium sp. A82]|uniref:group I intron-associated PD-(D/E)XK endonuclease n=1 Tax=Microbacterium sp. A82 TaxID=3450452 RepID=UPI003F382222
MVRERTYSDEQLADAITASTSWRGTLRALGLASTSSAAICSVRTRADELGLSYQHFCGQRRWTEDELRGAIRKAATWAEVGEALSIMHESEVAVLRGHAARLNIAVSHLKAPARADSAAGLTPAIHHLDRAGALLAAAWFTMSGCDVSWPLESSRYDLLVSDARGIRRVQVKTTRTRSGRSWKAYLSTTGNVRRTYGPEEIDEFFVIDGDLNCFLIPVADVGGLHAIHLSAYARYRQQPMANIQA